MKKKYIIGFLLTLLITYSLLFVRNGDKIKATSTPKPEQITSQESTSERLTTDSEQFQKEIAAKSETKKVQSENNNRASAPPIDANVPRLPLKGIFKVPSGADSTVIDNKVVITDRKLNQIGSIFSTESNKLDLTKKSTSEMFIKLDGDADGVTFVMHNDYMRTQVYSGTLGGGLGVYANAVFPSSLSQQLKNSFAIEFDTYYNGDGYDSKVNKTIQGHIAYTFPDDRDEYMPNSINGVKSLNHHAVQYPTFKLGDNVWRKLIIDWTPFDAADNGKLTYRFGDLDPVTAIIPRKVFLSDSVYWGFTGSTGAETESALVTFASVPGIVYYDDSLKLYSSDGTEIGRNTVVADGSDINVQYSGIYTGGKQNLLSPVMTFNLKPNQVYQKGTFTLNGQAVTPMYSNNMLTIGVADLSLQNDKIDVRFKIKNEGFPSFSLPVINSNLSGTNYMQIEGTDASYIIDADPPSGIGKLTVIDQGDTDTISKAADYKQFLSSLKDNFAPNNPESLSVTLKPDQNIQEIVKQSGPNSFELMLKDKVGNISYTKVPIFIKSPADKVVNDGTFLLKATDIKLPYTQYPKTNAQLTELIRTKSLLEIWKFNTDGMYEQIDSKLSLVDITKLPAVGTIPQINVYPTSFNYISGTTNLELPIDLTLTSDTSSVITEFKDEVGKDIHAPIILEGQIGKTIDLTKDETIKKAIQDVIENHYELDKSPDNEAAVPVVDGDTIVYYKFKGTLFIKSFPSNMTFGDKYLTKKFIKEEQPKYDIPLIIGDNRNEKTPWTLTATLEKALTSEESPSEVLSRALWYKTSESSKVMLYEGEAQPIETGAASPLGEYNISKNWDTNTTGLQLNVYSNEIIKKGDYKATILWQVSATP